MDFVFARLAFSLKMIVRMLKEKQREKSEYSGLHAAMTPERRGSVKSISFLPALVVTAAAAAAAVATTTTTAAAATVSTAATAAATLFTWTRFVYHDLAVIH